MDSYCTLRNVFIFTVFLKVFMKFFHRKQDVGNQSYKYWPQNMTPTPQKKKIKNTTKITLCVSF